MVETPVASPGRVKVSVIIATYKTGEPLAGVVECLDRQTLPPEEFEVVWVDDGSPDDTHERLLGYAATRPNHLVERIENSGWPGRPRNVGVRAARGRYVFFMDHDDYLFPEALERMAAFALENDLDIVLPKEVVAGWSRPGWASWRRQVPQRAHLDQATLQCITPHKLYRRDFVIEHDIWFPEGRIRLEDFDYNGRAWSSTDRIGVLADYPCYRWDLHGGNSHKVRPDQTVYWDSFEKSLAPIMANLGPCEKRDQLLVRWYRSRMLSRLAGESMVKKGPKQRENVVKRLHGLLPHFPPEIDRFMNPADRSRSLLLRANDLAGLVALAEADDGVHLRTDRTTVTQDGGRLRLRIECTLAAADATPLQFRRVDEALVRVLPASLDGTGVDTMNVRPDLAAAVGEVVIRARSTNVDWILPSTGSMSLVDADGSEPGQCGARFVIDAVLDPATAAGGRELDLDVWDLYYRLDGLGWTVTTILPAGGPDRQAFSVGGRSLTLFRTKRDFLALNARHRDAGAGSTRTPAAGTTGVATVDLAARMTSTARKVVRRVRKARERRRGGTPGR